MTSASAAIRSSSGEVTPNEQPASRWTSTEVPVNVMAGCRARGRAPARVAGSSTAVPNRPEVCTSSWPGRTAPVSARPLTRSARASSGTVSRTRSARASTSAGVTSGTSGSSSAARRTEASETPDTATGRCPASWSEAARAGPTRPAPTTPTVSRAGRSWASVGGIAFTRRWPSVPVRGGYRTIHRHATRVFPAVFRAVRKVRPGSRAGLIHRGRGATRDCAMLGATKRRKRQGNSSQGGI